MFAPRFRFVIGSALIASLVSLGTGCTPDVKDLRVEGIKQYRNRQHIESMATLRHVLELAPNDAQANYYMGLNYRTLAERKFRETDVVAAYRELDTAMIYYTQAIKSWPNYTRAIAAKNEALEARGKYAEALEVARHTTETTRGSAAVHFVFLGNEYRERGDYDNALRAYKTALSTDPDSGRAYAEMGRLYVKAGDRALAIDAYRRAYELDSAQPGVAEALASLGVEPEVHHAAHEPEAPAAE